ncbi:helix-turn-helix domain-containing protein [Natronobacterium gregoryi]|nr:helix-turn-helix domain-containing protein [Natronobacterium gregoryi]AFZ73451.1 putative DNA binding protein [Natronobacterium gregoryi SP2]SFI71636.1 hypothetical protein SAMN05443661_10451 [Natronobacterium gregoryi]
MISQGEVRGLCIELDLTLPDDHPCQLTSVCDCASSVHRKKMNGDCVVLVQGLPEESEDLRAECASNSIHEQCFHSIFEEYNCPALIVDVSGPRIRLQAHPADRETLKDIVTELSRLGNVAVIRIADLCSTDDVCDLRTVNCSQLTTKERETLTQAVDAGYYDRPRGADLEALADEFDVSKKTVSQRLRSAERKIVLDLLDDPQKCLSSPAPASQ